MSVNPRRKTYSIVRRDALINDFAVDQGIGCTVKAADFQAAAGVTDGVVPALYPVVVTNGIAAPWTAGVLTGLLIDPVNLEDGDASVGYMWTGVVDPTKLPVNCAAGTGHQFKFIANGA